MVILYKKCYNFNLYLQIVNLNAAVEQVKLQQQQLEHELDFIVAQQRELEECLVPLETELENTTTTGIDPEREQTYAHLEFSTYMFEFFWHILECMFWDTISTFMISVNNIHYI